MRNKIFKLFLVLMLMVSVLAVNANPVHAGGTNGLRITSGSDYRDFYYDINDYTLKVNSQTTDNIENLDISVEDINEERYAVLQLTKDTHLYCSEDYDNLIESSIPLKLTSYNVDGDDNTYTLYIHCKQMRQVGDTESYVGIECYDDLLIENVNIVFFQELDNISYLTNVDDRYKAIWVTGASYGDLEINNSDLTIYGTNGISNLSGYISLTNGSDVNMTLKTIRPEDMQFTDYDGTFIEAHGGGFELTGMSTACVSATIPDQNESLTSKESLPYIEQPLIACMEYVHVDSGSSLKVEEPNYHYFSAISTNLLDISGELIINGGVFGVSQLGRRKKVGLQAAQKINAFKFNNASFEITSLLAGLKVLNNDFFIDITRDINSRHTDFIKTVGDEDDAEALDFSDIQISAVSVINNAIFSIDIIDSYKFVAPADSSETDPSDYSEVVNDAQINKYKAIAIAPIGPQPIKLFYLSLTSNNNRAMYYPDDTYEGDADYFNDAFEIEYAEETGFTINVKKDFDFKFQTDEPARIFILCPAYGLHIKGNNHTLSFTTNSEGAMMTAPISCITFSSLFDSSISDLNIKLDTKDSVQTENMTYLFKDQGLMPRTTSLGDKEQNATFTLTNVHINANSSTPLFEISNAITSINNSSIVYNYQIPSFISVEQIVDSVIESNKDVTINNSNLEVYGNIELDKTKDAQMAISEVEATLDIINSNVKGNGIDLGLGAVNLNIEDSNLDIYTNRGAIIGFNSLNIKLSDGYHCNVSSKAAIADPDNELFPAIFSMTTPTFTLPEGCVFKAKYADGKEEEYNILNSGNYESVSIVTKGSEEEEEHHHHHGGYVIPSTGIK